MSSLEFNKASAAFLVALIVAMVTGLISSSLIHPEKLAKNAYPIAVTESSGAASGTAAPAPEKPAPIAADVFAKADAAAGEQIAKKCAVCHTFGKGEPAKVGPNLYGVVDRPRASAAGFSYSEALKSLGGNWTPQDIAAFIFSPKDYVPGTKMTFIGLPKPEDRANVIAFLNKQSDAPVDLSKAP
ncbi:MAG TPA: cytochrome c family protein [Aliidongia sp.]|nr:cytochrome c family protein [Aliidongia sp.]